MDQLKNVTYGRICANYHPNKADPNCSRLTVGGDRLNIPGDCGMPTIDMVTVKLHLNSVISTEGARYCTIDLKDFYLMTTMTRPEYMHMKIKDLPEEFVTMYNLTNKATPQAGILAQELLEQRLNKHGYHQSPITPGLCRHNYRPISFTLCVDDFTIKYIGRKHAEHLTSIPGEHYNCSYDWDGQQYLGMTIDWDYTGRAVHASMLNYIPKALTRFQHPTHCIPQHQCHRPWYWREIYPDYGASR